MQIGAIGERAEYLRELAARRETVLASITEQGKLTDELRAAMRDSVWSGAGRMGRKLWTVASGNFPSCQPICAFPLPGYFACRLISFSGG